MRAEHLMALWLAAVCGCTDEPEGPPVDPNDLDGDGIPNAADVCPTTRDPLQHDEDGDGFGDVCDVCPTMVDPLQADTTEVDNLQFEDGVGDVCDPQPGRGGTKIGAFHTFATDNSSSWLGTGWTIAGDHARAAGPAMWQHKVTESGGVVTVIAEFSSVTWGDEGRLSIVTEGDGISGGFSCAVVQDTDADGADELIATEYGVDTRTVNIGPLAPDMPLVLSALRSTDDGTGKGIYICRAVYNNRLRELKLVTGPDSVVGQYAFGSTGATTEVGSIIVYTSPLPCLNAGTGRLACPRP